MQDTRLVRTSVDGNSHTLVLRRTGDDSSEFGPLFDLLPDDEPNDVLAVTHEQSAAFLQRWRERIDRRPRNIGVVSVGEVMRSATPAHAPAQSVVRGVADPTDAEGIRDAAASYLDAWPDDGRTVAYLDSTTELVDDLGGEGAFEFLREFRRTLDAGDAAGYVCLRPAAHDCEFVREVGALFDTVVECVDSAAVASAKPSVSDCFTAIADRRRRLVLAELLDEDDRDYEKRSVTGLADAVAPRIEADREWVTASLIDVHLPKLANLGVVAYDRGRERVARGQHFERVEPYLRRALDRERQAVEEQP
ncbi:DUF7504 family protein [Halorussus litoreus]|uniref:DUF7504 family protein n=1 Tax=Halorussus litoreus TaxID=1710536 RepID=UPI0013003002|nr:hypothetical protein [Halorussus litoreus]